MTASEIRPPASAVKISARARAVAVSMTLALGTRAAAMKAEGIDVIDLGAGQPDFPTPALIRRRAHDDLEAGVTGYTPTAGIPGLRRAICAKLQRDNGLDFTPDRIIVSCGAKQSIHNALMALVDEGDEVLVPAPYWVSYPEMVTLAGGRTVPMPAGAAAHYKITPAQLAAAVTPRTVALIFNSPSNPTGMVYSEAEIRALGHVLRDRPHVTIISDEIYEKLTYGGERHVSFAAACPELDDRTLTINGMSKAYAMTGWRIGYAAGPSEIIDAMTRIQSHTTSGATAFCQSASIAALEGAEAEVEAMREAFDARRRVMLGRLRAIPGVHCPEPFGAFYLFPDVFEVMRRVGAAGSLELCEALLTRARVGCIPGVAFGDDRSIRLSYAAGLDQIQEAMNRIEAFIAGA